jgi:serine/threonine-protein kinase
MEQAISLYEQAVAKDPTFVAAYAQLTYLNCRMYWYATLDPTPARRARAKVAIDALVRLAPDRPETRMALGAYAYYCDTDFPRALAEYRAAAAQLPNDAQLLYLIGLTHRRLGAGQDAAVYFMRATELNPRDVTSAGNFLETLFELRRFAEIRDYWVPHFTPAFPDASIDIAVIKGRLELSHDVVTYLRELESLPPLASDPGGLMMRMHILMLRGDLAAAEHLLADPKFPAVVTFDPSGANSVVSPPAVLHRALVAFLRGQPEPAHAFADATVAYFRSKTWAPRQSGMVMIDTALAHALAGRPDEALKLLREGYAWQLDNDRHTALVVRPFVARTYLVLGRHDDAFAVLRELMTGPSTLQGGPEGTRLDPFWSRVKDDPRFEEILKLAKPL